MIAFTMAAEDYRPHEEIDTQGEHNTTFVIQKVETNPLSEIFWILSGIEYNIYDEDGRGFFLYEDKYKKLCEEYNGNPVGHKVTVNFSNGRGKHGSMKYVVNYIITESGKRIE